MSFNGAFTLSQGTDPTSFSLTDTSTGSDPSLTDRRVYLYLADGTTLTPEGSSTAYIDWPIVSGIGDVFDLTGILQRDYSINISVQWISSSPLPDPSTYTANQLYTFTANLLSFCLGLTQIQSGNPILINDNGYFPNRNKLRVFIDDAINCNTYNDQFNAQRSLDDAYKMQQNQKAYF